MQTVSRYLLSNMVIAYINGYHGRNSKVYDRQLKLYRGVSNPVTFTFKNEDQKPENIGDKKFEFNLIDTETNRSAITKEIDVLNTVQATGAVVNGDGSNVVSTTTLTISNANVTGTFVVGYQLKNRGTSLIGPSLSGPLTITNVSKNLVTGNTTLTLSIENQVVSSETVNITAGPKGSASVTLTEGDLLGLDAKFYSYSIREVATDGSRTVTFTDTAYNSAGTAEVLTGGYPQFADSQSIIDFTRSGSTSTSSYVDAKPGINNNSALHTVAVYPLNFAGTLTIEGTMSTEPEVTSTPQNQYFTISTNIIDTSDTIKYYNFNGILQGIRFVWTNDSGNTGVIDKILYRQ
jgi:hypothetical protein